MSIKKQKTKNKLLYVILQSEKLVLLRRHCSSALMWWCLTRVWIRVGPAEMSPHTLAVPGAHAAH